MRAPLLALALALTTPAAAAEWLGADPLHAWSFPRDHWSHPGHRVEWWYFTGHLASSASPARRFGYQLTVFRVGLSPAPPDLDSAWSASNLLMGHASITDLDRNEHFFSEVLYREAPLLARFGAYPEATLARSLGPVGTADPWVLRATEDGFEFEVADRGRGIAFTLAARAQGPPMLHGRNGYSPKARDAGAAASSLYYSYPRLETSGTLRIGDERHAVRGGTWMDHEFSSSQLAEDQVGWDWAGLAFDDGSALMLYRMRRSDGSTDFARATYRGVEGAVVDLAEDAWSLEATGRWTSEETGIEYPAGWRVRGPGVRGEWRIEPEVADQENVSKLVPGLAYWEGAVRVLDAASRVVGRGYVELTGYGGGEVMGAALKDVKSR